MDAVSFEDYRATLAPITVAAKADPAADGDLGYEERNISLYKWL